MNPLIPLAAIAGASLYATQRSGQRAKSLEDWRRELGMPKFHIQRFWVQAGTVPYPFAKDGIKWPGLRHIGGDGQVHVLMTPTQFLTLTGSPPEYVEIMVKPPATKLARKMRDGKTGIPYLNIGVSRRTGNLYVAGHEGRHRTVAAAMLGAKLVPVILNFYAANGSKWNEWSRGSISDYAPVKSLWRGDAIRIEPQNYGESFEKSWGKSPSYVELKLQ